jgi:predicted RNase H-like nuclease (RuvC/YqgF family)
MTAQELASLRNLGNECERAADEIDRLHAQRRELQAERERLLERLARCGIEARREERERLGAGIKAHARVPLTEAQIEAMRKDAADQGLTGIAPSLHLARAVEAWHGITGEPK